jgi:CCR4-NOT transcription complex subunit 1
VPHFPFTLELAALATRREFLNLEKWLQDKGHSHGVSFFRHLIFFLKDKVQQQEMQPSPKLSIPSEILTIFINYLYHNLK